jgi:DNA-binding HxlR family transcriptional regulator
MTAPAAKRGPIRSGATALGLLATPLNSQILRHLLEGPATALELTQATASPPRSTMRIYLRTLMGVHAIVRSAGDAPGSAEFSITPAGEELLRVTGPMREWLSAAPDGPIEFGTPAAKNAIRALADGWSSALVRALATRTLSLTELARLIPKLSYPALERRLSAMRMVGLIEAHNEEGRSTPFRATQWLRRAVFTLTAASEWERECIPELTPPIGRLDVEAAFLLAVPLIEVPPDLSAKVRLAVEIQRGSSPVFAGVVICVEAGKVTSCTPGVIGEAEGWVSGRPRSWLRRINLGEEDHLELGGDAIAGRAVLDALGKLAADRSLGEGR